MEWSWDGIGVELEWTKFVYTPRVAFIKIGFGNGIIRVLFFSLHFFLFLSGSFVFLATILLSYHVTFFIRMTLFPIL